jgi:hypothetical protein
MTNSETTTAAVVAPQGASVATENAAAKKEAKPKKVAPRGQKTGKKAVPRKQTATSTSKKGAKVASKKTSPGKESHARPDTKKALVIEMMNRKQGATLAEIMKATGWQAHSVRGFVAGALKKMDLPVSSTKDEAGERVYKMEK